MPIRDAMFWNSIGIAVVMVIAFFVVAKPWKSPGGEKGGQ